MFILMSLLIIIRKMKKTEHFILCILKWNRISIKLLLLLIVIDSKNLNEDWIKMLNTIEFINNS